MTALQCELNNFKGRIIFMSMFNDIVWDAEGNKRTMWIQFTGSWGLCSQIPSRSLSLLGPGPEEKWYGTCTHNRDGTWDRRATGRQNHRFQTMEDAREEATEEKTCELPDGNITGASQGCVRDWWADDGGIFNSVADAAIMRCRNAEHALDTEYTHGYASLVTVSIIRGSFLESVCVLTPVKTCTPLLFGVMNPWTDEKPKHKRHPNKWWKTATVTCEGHSPKRGPDSMGRVHHFWSVCKVLNFWTSWTFFGRKKTKKRNLRCWLSPLSPPPPSPPPRPRRPPPQPAKDLEDSKSTSVGVLCIFGSQTFVPTSWMCKKQTSVSHSSKEAKVISLDAGLRMDGIAALALWDLVIEIFHSVPNKIGQPREEVWGNPLQATKPNMHYLIQFKHTNVISSDIDRIPSYTMHSFASAMCYVFEDNGAVIKNDSQRSKSHRRVSRTHRVALDACLTGSIWTPKSKSVTLTPSIKSQTS